MESSSIILTFTNGSLAGKSFTYKPEEGLEVYIGKGDSCDLIVKDPGVSGEHCGLFYENGNFIIEDFESTNGTIVNGKKILKDVVLKQSDILMIGPAVKVEVSFPSSNKKSAPVKATPIPKETPIPENIDDWDEEEDSEIKRIKKKVSPTNIDFYIDLKDNFMALPTKNKAVFITIFVLFFSLIIFALTRSKKDEQGFDTSYKDFSENIFDLSVSLEGIKGYYRSQTDGRVLAAENPFKVRYKFNYEERRKLTLFYRAAGIEFFNEVMIYLNNKELKAIPITQQGVLDASIVFPIDNLKVGENLLEFVNTRSKPNKKEQWVVQPIRLDVEILPSPDSQKAAEFYAVAEKFYDQKLISRGNRYKAYVHYNQTTKFLELMPVKPPLYNDAIKKMTLIDSELNKIVTQALYMARRKIDFGKDEEAQAALREILEEIPDENDPRHRNALRFLDAIKE